MKKILIAEDDESTQELLKHVVSSAGFDVATASDGQEALTAILGTQPDLVILDIMLPGENGLDVCRKMKGSAELKNIPVFIISIVENKALGFSLYNFLKY